MALLSPLKTRTIARNPSYPYELVNQTGTCPKNSKDLVKFPTRKLEKHFHGRAQSSARIYLSALGYTSNKRAGNFYTRALAALPPGKFSPRGDAYNVTGSLLNHWRARVVAPITVGYKARNNDVKCAENTRRAGYLYCTSGGRFAEWSFLALERERARGNEKDRHERMEIEEAGARGSGKVCSFCGIVSYGDTRKVRGYIRTN